uniref:PHD and ring finger domains 1 n=1 Tax=Salarias fasciatus TaxID=181472 RepID=A0A672FFK4_SALFA
MDEDDSQDELINRSTSHSKGKRAAVWAISDDSDDSEESAEGESDSEEEEEGEDHVNGEDDEEEEEEEEEEEGNEEEDDEEELEDGAVGGTSAGFEVLSSDEDSDKCPICLNSFTNQPVATPESCEHYFCFDCILEWAKNANSCPVDRLAFNSIYLRKCYGGKVKKMITVQKPVKEGQEETVDLTLEQTNCEVCGGSDREDRLLLCDGCDAGYHMECLTPPLNSVPVEEWFCPECQANNRHLNLAEELSDSESLPSTARPATSRSQPRAAGPTRAIARTQQSERVRANVNRHRITQARSSQLAPTYLIQSTWLDETINAVVAGLNTAVYVRDFTPRVPSGRRRKYVKRRKVKTKDTSSAQGKRSKSMNTMVKRRKRRVRRTKRRKQKVVKKSSTSRSRIASNLGIVKDKKSSSLPTVYRPSEHTLSNMRVDIGAASLSIYGDPFDLDPFADREEDGEQARVTSLLEAKRRGISRSALRSHQPVARPITASLSRRDLGVPQSGDVVEPAPVPDLLGSILSGQSMLLMDSSDVVINRDGSLKATKPVTPSPLLPASRSSSSSGDAGSLISPVSSPSLAESSLSLHHSGALPGPSSSAVNRDLTPSSSRSPPFMASPPSHTQTTPHADVSRRRHPGLLSPHSARPATSAAHWGSNGAGASREISPPTVHPTPDFSTKSKGTAQSQSQSKKAPTKPMWVDVSVLPRIPKIKRDNSSEGTSQRGISDRSGRGNGSNPSAVSNGYGVHEAGTNSLSGDKGRQQSVDQQRSRVDGQAQRNRPGGAGSSSSSFSNSFSSASSSTGYPASHSRHPSAPSSSSAVSFRINSSGNSWHSRRLSSTSSSASGDARPGHCREKEDEAKKRQLRRDKQKLLASRTAVGMEQENIYDPFNPTLSDSSSSGSEAESTDPVSSQSASHEGRPPVFGNLEATVKEENSREINTETQQVDASQEQSRTTQRTVPEVDRHSTGGVKVKKESTILNIKTEKPADVPDIEIKKEPGLDEEKDSERCDESVNSCINSETLLSTPSAHHSLDLVKTGRRVKKDSGQSSAAQNRPVPEPLASSSATSKKTLKEEIKSDSTPTSKSLSRDSHQSKRPPKPPKEQCSSSSETDRSRRGDRHASGQAGRNKERDKDKERSSRRSPPGERRRARSSSSDSSQPGSPDRARRKRRRSRSRSKEDNRRRRSRSASSSSSREHSQRKKHKQRGRDDERERRRPSKDKRRSRSRSKSQSKSRSRSRSRSKSKDRNRSRSRSRSRSRERRKEQARQQNSSHSSRDKVESRPKDKRRPRSRSTSRERRKKEVSSKSSQKTSGPSASSSKDTKQSLEKKKVKDVTRSSVQEKRVSKVYKQASPSCASAAKVMKEEKDVTASQRADLAKEVKPAKEIKKEKLPCLDMFEDSPSIKPIKKEEPDTPPLTVDINEENHEDTPQKTESCELAALKCEPDTSEICQLPPVTSPSTMTAPKTECQETLSESAAQSSSSTTQQNTAGSTVPVKHEARQPSDSDEDFNVDVMLDNLDYVKSEPPDGSGTAPKQEKEGQPASTLAGTKTKTQVKRVTWNLQEPEGPQPEKSASKLALYKLKLKQEGARRPFLAVQTSGQGVSGIAGDPSSKGAAVPPSTSSHSDGLHPEALSTSGQTEGEDGDQSRKDKYLKKLHMLERAIEEVKLAIKPFYQRRDINKDEYKEILRKAVQKVCHSKSGEINPVKVGNLVKAYVDKYKHARKHRKEDDSGKAAEVQPEAMQISDSP